ncbi:unnamed protein product [Rotaria magnacalcarata]|uniref:Uncharacterized protein n=1 Tax=Rotaria magnacalcarata TaxID=392030 RepID=A0A8S3DYT1_9BILA|nr:unnamed protein product [Rotaria magnacalcarata]
MTIFIRTDTNCRNYGIRFGRGYHRAPPDEKLDESDDDPPKPAPEPPPPPDTNSGPPAPKPDEPPNELPLTLAHEPAGADYKN